MKKKIGKGMKRFLALVAAFAIALGGSRILLPPVTVEAQDDTQVAMYRLYNPNSGEHLYTANTTERDNLKSIGWKYEGIGWFAPASSGKPVYRVYNPNNGDHHYTMDSQERDYLVSIGWKDEGIGWYSDEAERVKLYRQFNPNAQIGTHNYTTSKTENDYLASVGWNAEGTAWYGIAEGVPYVPTDISGDDAYASIEADVTLRSTNANGTHAKLRIAGGGAIASFGIQYEQGLNQFQTKTAFLLENVYDIKKAAKPGPEGKHYVFISQANRDVTYKLRFSWDRRDNMLHCYVNDEELPIDPSLAKTNMRPNTIFAAVEGSAMRKGDVLDCSFSNVKIKIGDSSDRCYGTSSDFQIEGNYGLHADLVSRGTAGPSPEYQNTKPERGGYNFAVNMSGTVTSLNGYDNWDETMQNGGKPVSAVVQLAQDHTPD